MNCLIVVPSLRRAGAENQSVDLANGLASLGHEVHLCCFEPQLDLRERLSSDVVLHHVERRRKYDFSLIARIAKLIDCVGIDVALGVMQFAALITWLAAMKSARSPPVLASVHTTVNRGLKEELQDYLIYRAVLKRLQTVIFVCSFQRDYWLKRFSELNAKSRVICNGIDIAKFDRRIATSAAFELRTTLGIPGHGFVVTCVAGFRPEKGHRFLLEAFARLPSDTYLLLVGDGPERSNIQTFRDALGLSGRVHFLGNLSDVRPAIASAHATVLASVAVETFSLAMLESMAIGVPMVATRLGGVEEAITDRETGLLCNPKDVGCLTEQLRYLYANRGESARLGTNAFQRVKDCFALDTMVRQYELAMTAASTQTDGVFASREQ